jgi:hypothetical protein
MSIHNQVKGRCRSANDFAPFRGEIHALPIDSMTTDFQSTTTKQKKLNPKQIQLF